MLADCLHYARRRGRDPRGRPGDADRRHRHRRWATSTPACSGRDQEWVDRLMAAGERSGDHLWPLPLHDTFRRLYRSDIADMANSGTSGGRMPCYAARFLSGVRRRRPVGAPRHRRHGRPDRGRATTTPREAPGSACGCWSSWRSRCAELRPVGRAAAVPRHRARVRRGRDRPGGRGARPRRAVPGRAGAQAAELGLLGIPLPEEWGGAGAGHRSPTRSRSRSWPGSTARSRSRSPRTPRWAPCRSTCSAATSSSGRWLPDLAVRPARWARSG